MKGFSKPVTELGILYQTWPEHRVRPANADDLILAKFLGLFLKSVDQSKDGFSRSLHEMCDFHYYAIRLTTAHFDTHLGGFVSSRTKDRNACVFGASFSQAVVASVLTGAGK